jgi:hypothetical protein
VPTREEIEKRMDELAWKYVETHDRDIIEELVTSQIDLRKSLFTFAGCGDFAIQ